MKAADRSDRYLNSEDEKSAWSAFTASGSVADYLRYTAAKHARETVYEDNDGRNSYQRADRQGIGQGDNGSDKG